MPPCCCCCSPSPPLLPPSHCITMLQNRARSTKNGFSSCACRVARFDHGKKTPQDDTRALMNCVLWMKHMLHARSRRSAATPMLWGGRCRTGGLSFIYFSCWRTENVRRLDKTCLSIDWRVLRSVHPRAPVSACVCVCVLSSGVVVIENTPKKCVRKRDSVHLFRIGCTCDGGCCCRFFFAAGRKRKRRSPLGDLDKTATPWTEHNLYLPFWVARRDRAIKWEEEKEREKESLYASVTHLNLITSIRQAPLGLDIWDEKEKNRVTVRVSFPTRRFVFLPGNWGNR